MISRLMSSIAATGFGLAGLCIGDQRGYGKSADILERVRKTLRFLANTLPNEHGFFFHFVHMETGSAGKSASFPPLILRFCFAAF